MEAPPLSVKTAPPSTSQKHEDAEGTSSQKMNNKRKRSPEYCLPPGQVEESNPWSSTHFSSQQQQTRDWRTREARRSRASSKESTPSRQRKNPNPKKKRDYGTFRRERRQTSSRHSRCSWDSMSYRSRSGRRTPTPPRTTRPYIGYPDSPRHDHRGLDHYHLPSTSWARRDFHDDHQARGADRRQEGRPGEGRHGEGSREHFTGTRSGANSNRGQGTGDSRSWL